MKRLTVDSKNIKSIGHDPVTRTLEVEFHSGAIYQYMDVPRVIYAAILIAPSSGSFFHKNVVTKGYAYSIVGGNQKQSA